MIILLGKWLNRCSLKFYEYISGFSNKSLWIINYMKEDSWNCLVCDEDNYSAWIKENSTLFVLNEILVSMNVANVGKVLAGDINRTNFASEINLTYERNDY